MRAVVRREGSAPALPGVEEWVGEFFDPELAARVVEGADAVVTTVHPMGSDRETQHRIAVEGTPVLARAARDAGVDRLVHVSTAAVYDRSPGVGDVDEASPLVGDDADDYAVTKRDTDAALAEVDGITRVLVRPPAILGPGETSVWNSLRPAAMRDDEGARHAVPAQTFAWIHVDDLAALIADVAAGVVADRRRRRARARRRRLHGGQRRGPARPRSRTTHRRSPPRSASSRSGTTARVDRADPGRPRRRLGLGPAGRPGAGAGRDRRRAAVLEPSPRPRPGRPPSAGEPATNGYGPDLPERSVPMKALTWHGKRDVRVETSRTRDRAARPTRSCG